MNIAVCDDWIEELDTLMNVLEQWQSERKTALRYKVFRSAVEMLDAAREEQFTLYLLDVMMPGMDGITAAREIREFDDTADIAKVSKAIVTLGYELSEDDTSKVFEAFKNVSGKKQVGAKELDALIATVAHQVPPTYRVQSYVLNSGNLISSTANIVLEKGSRTLKAVGMGDGPVDAAFRTIEQIIGHHYELDDFQIQSVTEGREAMGEALVKLRSNGKLYSGKGISTDIIGASIIAYVNALNKIVYEEETV